MTSTASTLEIRPFRVEFPQADLDDLRERLERTRFAPAAPGDSWDYGTPDVLPARHGRALEGVRLARGRGPASTPTRTS